MGERDSSVRGRVIRKWKDAGKPNWSLERTLEVCINTDSEFEKGRPSEGAQETAFSCKFAKEMPWKRKFLTIQRD